MDGEGDATWNVTSSMSMPSAAEADSVEFIVEATASCTPSTVEFPGTVMVAVMTTLPGVTSIVTYSGSTPAALATLACRSVVSV